MDEELQSVPAFPEPPPSCELLILYTSEAHEWAAYLQQILRSSNKFRKKSIVLYTVSPADQLHGYNFDCFQNCKCIVVLLSGAFVDDMRDPDLQGALQRLLCPPHKVVALLCGIQDDSVLAEMFSDWPYWRKLYAEDEPVVYVSTILESVIESRMREAEDERTEHVTAAPSGENPWCDQTQEVVSEEQEDDKVENAEAEAEAEAEVEEETSTNSETNAATDLSCVTVQPNRVQCGDKETIFIIFKHTIGHYSELEVEFSSENTDSIRIRATVENDSTLSVTAPDFPAGVVSLTLHCTDQSSVSLKPVTYYTNMGEVSRFLESAVDPANFICQAFSLTSNTTESLDTMLTESLKSKLPATGLQLFGIRQIEEDNMATYQRNEELPTLLHFAAKYGLKKLTMALLQCPGALQAYSVMNKNGDYPNTLAQKSGFSDLRQFMDEFVETADMLKSHVEETSNTEEAGEVYEMMTASSQDIMMRYSGCSEDIYESMLEINPECAEDLYEVMTAVDENPEETMLRKFFQAKPQPVAAQSNENELQPEEQDTPDRTEFDLIEEEEDPYNLSVDDIYDTVDTENMYTGIINRPPAPVPRPEPESEQVQSSFKPYISGVFSDKGSLQMKREPSDKTYSTARHMSLSQTPIYDPYAGMKTPGQRQLISLQERVKVGEITVDEAVQEFKSWQFDHERRSHSLRYQQDNLKRLRDSITRRHKEREKAGQLDFEITAPLQTNLYWSSGTAMECAVYEPTPKLSTAPPPGPPVPPPPVLAAGHVIKRGSWKTGSTSSNSSTESNRLSTHSTISYSSGTEPELDDSLDSLPPPPRPPRPSDTPPFNPPPRIPPRIPERVPEKILNERYISCPTRALPQIPTRGPSDIAPPVPRRQR